MKFLVIITFSFLAIVHPAHAQQYSQDSIGISTQPPPQPQGQQGWVQQDAGTTDNFYYVSLINQDTCWATCSVGNFQVTVTVHQTTDGGSHWTTSHFPPGAVSFADPLNGIVIDHSKNPIYHTADGGMNWDTVSIPNNAPLTSICRVGHDTIFLTCGGIARSIDGGKTWDFKIMGLGLKSVNFCNSKVGFAVGVVATWFGPPQRPDAAEIYVTTDGGENWVPHYSGIQQDLKSVHVWDYFHAVVGGNNDVAYTSDDGDVVFGGHWIGSAVEAPVPVIAQMTFPTTATGYACGNGGSIIYTADSGHNWRHQVSGVTTNLSSITFVDPKNGFAVGELGVILHTTNAGMDWVQIAPPANVPLSIEVFPQPSSGVVQLSYSLPQVQDVTLSIFDVTGRRILTVVDHELQQPGLQRLTVEGTRLPVGVYTYQLQSERYIGTGKFTLVR